MEAPMAMTEPPPSPAPASSAASRRVAAGPRAIAIGAVMLLHVGLVGWLQHAWHRADAHREQPRSTVRMVTLQLPPLSKTATNQVKTAPSTRVEAKRTRPDPEASPARTAVEEPAATRSTARVVVPAPEVAPPEEAPRSTIVVAAPAPASGASGPTGRDLLYGAATQHAVRQAAKGQPLLSERADQASLAPEKVDASTKLGKEMMKGASGDCLKGEFAGGGAGLLSLPFWVLAEARGKCRR